MLSSLFLGLCAANSALSLSVPAKRNLGSNVIDLTADNKDDMLVLLADGSRTVLNFSTWAEQLMYEGFLLEKPELDHTWLNRTYEIDTDGDGDTDVTVKESIKAGVKTNRTIKTNKRKKINDRMIHLGNDFPGVSCGDKLGAVVDRKEHFVDWDAQMSPVDCASNGQMDVTIVKGWAITNTITVSTGMNIKVIKDLLDTTIGVSYSKSWQTQDSLYNKGSVYKGECGCMITKPLTTRAYGRIIKGCPGAVMEVGTWVGEDRGRGTYDHFEWVAGAVGICSKNQTNPPLSRCQGKGNFI